jgi:hypothetical protein
MTAASDKQAGGEDCAQEERVMALAREIADTINAGTVDGRDVLREIAVNLVRDGVQITDPERPADAPASGTGTFNPFGIGIPLILMGGVLVFLFPLVGLLMFAAAAMMIAWGVGATLLARS